METASVILEDPETKDTYTFIVSKEDRDRALVDDEFLNSLLRHAKQSNNIEQEQTSSSEQLYVVEQEEADQIANKNQPSSSNTQNMVKKVWGYNETLLLITTVETRYEEMNHPLKRKTVWKCISEELENHGYDFPAEICMQKWKNLVRTFKNCKDKNKETGSAPNRFAFYSRLNEFLGNKPNMSSPHVIDTDSEFDQGQEQRREQEQNAEPNAEEETAKTPKTKENDCIKKTPKRENAKAEYYKKKGLFVEIKNQEKEENERYREKKLLLEERKIKALEELVELRRKKYEKDE